MLHEVTEVDEVERLALEAREAGHELQRLRPRSGDRGGDLGHVRDRGLAERRQRGVEVRDGVAVHDRHGDEVAVGLAARLHGDAVEQVDVSLHEAVGDVLAAAALAHRRERRRGQRVGDHDLLRAGEPLAERRQRGDGLVVGHEAGGLVDHVEAVDPGLLHAHDQALPHLRDGELLGAGRSGVDVPSGVATAVVEEREAVVLGGVPVGGLVDEPREHVRLPHRDLAEVADLVVPAILQQQQLGGAEVADTGHRRRGRIGVGALREVEQHHDVDVGVVGELGDLGEVLDHELRHRRGVADGVDHHRPVRHTFVRGRRHRLAGGAETGGERGRAGRRQGGDERGQPSSGPREVRRHQVLLRVWLPVRTC